MKKKIQKAYQDYGFGFLVTLLNVPVTEVRGEWVPNVNQRELQERVIEALAMKPARLNGSEVRFIRLFSEMTLAQFAERFAVTHPAVLKWERTGNHATGMGWTTEKDLRLFALSKLAPRAQEFVLAYERLTNVVPEKEQSIKINWQKKIA